MKRNNQCWLLKTEAVSYSIDDLKIQRKTRWDGVRNYQARNFMKNEMKVGDQALIYHSGGKVPAVVGLAEISGVAIPDASQFDKTSQYFDKKASELKPNWWAVEVRFVEKFSTEIPLRALHNYPALAHMVLLKKGSRLSIQPVKAEEFETIFRIARQTKNPSY